ncbi:hypothetical protein [Desulfomonile tiedjei]|uniref:hypothetical protein n=1 Tax=Desulfomonile tiedjei TaxID=2358 RepID=UPI0002D6CD47|nr:hypothetical protein [Desulfomonile tiedjei]
MNTAFHSCSSEKYWEDRIRQIFWIVGILAGATLTYTTRHFINGDAINYIEMGEAFRQANVRDFVNLTASPGYAVLLGLTQSLLNTNPWTEIPLLKGVNFVLLLIGMWACDFLLRSLRKSYAPLSDKGMLLPWFMIMALAYAMFLFCALVWITPKLVAPDMATFSTTLLSMAMILQIRENPQSYRPYLWLGVLLGIAYLFKTFFFSFSLIFLGAAVIACGSIQRAIPRITLALVSMILVSALWIIPLSMKLGTLSYGETGPLNYAIYVKAEGKGRYCPVILDDRPEVLLYKTDFVEKCTRPATFDPSYWKVGMKPVFDLKIHLTLVFEHALQICSDKPWLFLAVLIWIAWNITAGGFRFRESGTFVIPLYLVVPSLVGILMYSVIHVEMRYIAPFIFLVFLGVVLCLRYDTNHSSMKNGVIGAFGMLAVILVLLALSVIDQSIRGSISGGTKPTYKEAYSELFAVKDYLQDQGLQPGDQVAVIGYPPIYWARISGVKISAEIPNEKEMMSATVEDRKKALATLRPAGVNAVVVKGKEFAGLIAEGWKLIPGTRDFYAFTFR